MVMSTKEQETFQRALSAQGGLKSFKKELSCIDVRQVQTKCPGCSLGP